MPFAVSSLIACSFFDRCVNQMPRSTFGAKFDTHHDARLIRRFELDALSAVSTYETDLAVLGREDFWLIVAFRGSEDETEIHSG
jgi:hypothetical protein